MRRAIASVLLGLLVPATGCAPGEIGVSGTVTLDGHPLEDGNIAFRPLPVSSTAEAVSGPITGGKFQVKLRPGGHRVEITANRPAPAEKGAHPAPAPKSVIPEKYNVKSELTEEVRAGAANEFDFALTSH